MTERDLPYNRSLADLESLLARVQRPGDFCMHAALAVPMPLVQVDGVGSLSFPLPPAQAAALIAAAERAPYGRGEQTVLDTSVRRVWQIDAARVRLGGKLQAGVGSALPALEVLIAADGASADALDMAERIVAHWSQHSRPRHVVGRGGRCGLACCAAWPASVPRRWANDSCKTCWSPTTTAAKTPHSPTRRR